mgnify:FL=1
MIYAAKPIRRTVAQPVNRPVALPVRGSWDEDAIKYVRAVNNLSTTPLPAESIFEIDGLVRTLKGQPNPWAGENGVTIPSASYWDNIDFALLHAEAGNTDSGAGSNMQPLRGRQWVEATPDANGTWTNSTGRPWDTFTADAGDGFTAVDTTTGSGEDDRCGASIGSVTSGHKVRVRFNYTYTGTGSPSFQIQLRNSIDSTLYTSKVFVSGSGTFSGTYEGILTANATDSSTWFCIAQTVANGSISNFEVSNFKVWKNWESTWTTEARTAPTHDAIKGGHYVLQNGAPRDGAYDGSDDAAIAKIDGLSFSDCFFGYVGTTDFDASHVAIMAMGGDSSVDAQNDPDGFLVKRNGGGSNFSFLRSTNISANHTRVTADETVTDIQAFINNDTLAGLRHEGTGGTDDATPGDVTMAPEFITVGARYLSSSLQNEQPLEPYGIVIMNAVPSAADGDAIAAAFETCVTNLKAF